VEEHPVLVLCALGGTCAERQDDGRGVRLGPRGRLQSLRPSGLMEHRVGTRQQASHRVGQAAGGRRAGAVASMLHRCARLCAMATCAIALCGAPRGRGSLQRGDAKAGGSARAHACRLAPHPPWWRPGPGARDARVIHTAPGRRRLALGLGPRAPSVLAPPRLWEGGRGVAAEDGMAREATDTIGPAARRAPRAHLWWSAMPIATAPEGRRRPVGTQRGQEPWHEHRLFCAAGTGPRAEGGRAQGVRGPCKNVAWKRAVVLRVRRIAGPLLRARRRRIGVVDLQDHGGRRLGLAGDAGSHQSARKTLAVLTVSGVCQTGARGGTRAGMRRSQGGPLHPACASGVPTEVLGVMRVCIPGGEVRQTLGHKAPPRRRNRGWGPLSVESGGEARCQAHRTVDTPSQEGAAVYGPGPSLAIRSEGLPSDGRKAQVFWGRMRQKQTSWALSGMAVSHLPFSQRLTRGLYFFVKNSG
jgi:hypothetical protein